MQEPFYNPNKSYEENFTQGPFGAFASGEVHVNEGEPEYDFFGQKVYAPFGIPAGPLLNAKFVQGALDQGFDIATYKTVRSTKYPCHPWPNVLSVSVDGDLTLDMASKGLTAGQDYHEPLSITNSFGVPSQDPEFWKEDLRKLLASVRKGQVVVGSFQGTKNKSGNVDEYINDYVFCARNLVEAGVKVLEVNFSCPNEGTSNLLCFDVERSATIARAIKSAIGNVPLIVKIAYFKDDKSLSSFVQNVLTVADGVSAINTIPSEVRTAEGIQALPGEGRLVSGICGAGIKWAGLDMVKRLSKVRSELGLQFKIIGVGGVMNENDFMEYRQNGADFVESATGAMWNPNLAQKVKSLL